MKIDGVIVFYLLAAIAMLIPMYLFLELDATLWIKKLIPKYKKGYGIFGFIRILILLILVSAGFFFFLDYFDSKLK